MITALILITTTTMASAMAFIAGRRRPNQPVVHLGRPFQLNAGGQTFGAVVTEVRVDYRQGLEFAGGDLSQLLAAGEVRR